MGRHSTRRVGTPPQSTSSPPHLETTPSCIAYERAHLPRGVRAAARVVPQLRTVRVRRARTTDPQSLLPILSLPHTARATAAQHRPPDAPPSHGRAPRASPHWAPGLRTRSSNAQAPHTHHKAWKTRQDGTFTKRRTSMEGVGKAPALVICDRCEKVRAVQGEVPEGRWTCCHQPAAAVPPRAAGESRIASCGRLNTN
jgi:hypothetical protein